MFKSILTSALLFTGYFLGTSALPSELEKKQVVEATLTFHGGPASYSMTFAATGQVFFTENDLNINHIDIDVPDDYQCKVYVKDPVTGYRYPNYTGIGNKRVPIGPPAPVYGVSCFPSCQPVYGMCYDNLGQFVAPCCNGICAATRCRPIPSSSPSSTTSS